MEVDDEGHVLKVIGCAPALLGPGFAAVVAAEDPSVGPRWSAGGCQHEVELESGDAGGLRPRGRHLFTFMPADTWMLRHNKTRPDRMFRAPHCKRN
jgi:hypothetical protein